MRHSGPPGGRAWYSALWKPCILWKPMYHRAPAITPACGGPTTIDGLDAHPALTGRALKIGAVLRTADTPWTNELLWFANKTLSGRQQRYRDLAEGLRSFVRRREPGPLRGRAAVQRGLLLPGYLTERSKWATLWYVSPKVIRRRCCAGSGRAAFSRARLRGHLVG
jgi:hypothetical protein